MGRQAGKILILLLCLAGCVKDKPTPPTNTHTTPGNVYIVCEGNFGTGDATLYTYDPATNTAQGDIYKAVNNQQLGDVFQSMVRMGDSLYLCINNSDKIIVLHATDHKLMGTINIPKPRYIVQVNARKAYVSTLYSNDVYAIDPTTLQVTGITHLANKNAEGMCLYQNNVIACAWDTLSNTVSRIDAASGQVVQQIQVGGYAPHAALIDKEQMLWVLSGNAQKNRQAALTRIDPSTGNILKVYTFPDKCDPIKPVFNATHDTLYYIQVKYDGSATDNGIYRIGIHDAALPTTAFVQGVKYQYFWALGIEPATGNIYVGDPKGFIQKGSVSVYRPDGSLVSTFVTGLGPGGFYFRK